MFYIFYYNKLNKNNNELKNLKENNIIEKNDKTESRQCILCFEGEEREFYNYNNDKYLHNCLCTPNIHYDCFKTVYQKNNYSCIICRKRIHKTTCDCKYDCDDVIYFFRISRLKSMFIFILLLLFVYIFIIDYDFSYIRKEDFIESDMP